MAPPSRIDANRRRHGGRRSARRSATHQAHARVPPGRA
jgi:hypothetical protein